MGLRLILCSLCFVILPPAGESYLTWIATRLPLEGEPAPPGSPWPMPKTWSPSPDQKTWHPDHFQFESDVTGCTILDKAITRYANILHLLHNGKEESGLNKLESVTISMKDDTCNDNFYPNFESDESYQLTIDGQSTARLVAETVWGTLRGLETLSQLLYLDEVTSKCLVNYTTIDDAPRYQHRGFMADTARHFIPMSILMKILDGMSYDKLNVFHWHVVDDQSFPYPSRTFPNLTHMGSYSPSHQYSRSDVARLVEEARLRGIRVIPEFDTPGHSWSWGRALPKLLTPCWGKGEAGGPFVPNYPLHTDAEIMNPMEEYTFDVLGQIYQEIIEDFPDEYIHLGMDEAYYSCWESSPVMTQWMLKMNFSEYYEVENYYCDRITDMIEEKGAKYMIWQDPIDMGVKVAQSSLIEVWKDKSQWDQLDYWQVYARKIADQNYQMILSAPWYLNMITYGQDWRKYYSIDPNNFTENTEQHKLIQGGEACLWAEYVDGTNIIDRLWPRMSSMAERLWSPSDVNDEEEAKYRLDQHRCRFVRRGLNAQPILNGYCGDYDWGMSERIISGSSNLCLDLTLISYFFLTCISLVNYMSA